jgi:hypothetical protein
VRVEIQSRASLPQGERGAFAAARPAVSWLSATGIMPAWITGRPAGLNPTMPQRVRPRGSSPAPAEQAQESVQYGQWMGWTARDEEVHRNH